MIDWAAGGMDGTYAFDNDKISIEKLNQSLNFLKFENGIISESGR